MFSLKNICKGLSIKCLIRVFLLIYYQMIDIERLKIVFNDLANYL